MSNLGKIAYQMWYRPKHRIHWMGEMGGPLGVIRFYQNRSKAMRLRAPLCGGPDACSGPPVVLLTGFRFEPLMWYLMASMRSVGLESPLIVLSDSKEYDKRVQELAALYPEIDWWTTVRQEANLPGWLRNGSRPGLKKAIEQYPITRQVIHAHFVAKGYFMYCDCDVLFHSNPDCLSDFLAARVPFFMLDRETNYGYPLDSIQSLVPDLSLRVNAGLYASHPEAVDWPEIDEVLVKLYGKYGETFFVAQLIAALVLGQQVARPLPKEDYVLMPNREEAKGPTGVLHHYVNSGFCRDFFFRWGVPQVEQSLARVNIAPSKLNVASSEVLNQ